MRRLKINLKKIGAVLAFSFVVVGTMAILAPVVSADLPGAPTLCNDLKGLNCQKYSLNQLIIRVINWILAITLAVDVLFIIIGGFLYITSAGNEDRAKKGKTTVINAIIGLVIIILAYVIAQVVSNFFSTESTAV